jgi:hypothetical protein
MGGELTAESELGKGAVFSVKVPRTQSPSLREGAVAWANMTPEPTPATGLGSHRRGT